MKFNQLVTRAIITISNREEEKKGENLEQKYLRRILVSGIMSLLLILIIIYSLPYTILSYSSLFEYSTIVAMVIFLFILLVRYFAILISAYLYINEYTFSSVNGYAPFVSIIVPVYNEGKVIRNSISSLLKLDYFHYEIIIVNDGSTDDTKQIAESMVGYQDGLYGKVLVSLINQPNLGKARALNAGIFYSKSDFVLCMDGDSQLSPESIKVAVRHFKDPKIGAVAGNVKVQNRKRFFTDLQALEYIEGLNMARSAQSYFRLVNIIPGPIGIFRRSAIEQAGFYSSDTYAEDADLTLKLLSKGWKIYYEPKSISYTEAPVTLQQLLKQRYRWTRGILQSIRKHKKIMLSPATHFAQAFILWVMSFEALIWPTMNIAANAFFIFAALFFGFSHLIFFWWAGLAILDLVTALYCVAVEKEEFRLIWYAIIYRMFFILIIDICKTMSTIEEFLGIRMTWGKLERTTSGKSGKIAVNTVGN
ncbi:MAG: glycosyl transferase [Ignavibacteriales bacterium UTCHB2]|jgi:cellulose synthase/poly-beta-1,6-N-acetylglucosamine synthase-like glycosyltransferase|nr:MAG: Poly-beta-1,6-N-acetyl-D-glucosamine synthase [Ignavibacteria bacterium ADurb.Bin266]OQY73066.1 MAG: glycosyl transferase [Ignavibacteriales bacterium UTCHB2]HQI40117.1 glycosyltransferase [Ignavibacteriaceae bacterium]